jgi:hypothetical protein
MLAPLLLLTVLATPDDPPQQVTLRVNGSAGQTELRPGWAATFVAEITSLSEGPFTLSGRKSWTDEVSLEATDENGVPVELPLRMVTQKDGTVNVGAGEAAVVAWVVLDSAWSTSAKEIRLRAVLDTTKAPEGWKGRAASPTVECPVRKPELTPKLLDAKACAAAEALVLVGDEKRALQVLDTRLTARPDSYAVLERRGDVLTTMERFAEAFQSYNRALRAVAADESVEEPPQGLLEKIRAVQGKMAG